MDGGGGSSGWPAEDSLQVGGEQGLLLSGLRNHTAQKGVLATIYLIALCFVAPLHLLWLRFQIFLAQKKLRIARSLLSSRTI